MPEQRDPRLARSLERLEAPEHADGFWERLDAVLADEASRTAPPRRPWRRRPRLVALVAAAVVVAAVVVAAGLLSPAGSPLRPGDVTAAEIVRKLARALAETRTLSGEVRVRAIPDEGPGLVDDRWRFVLTAPGDVRLQKLVEPSDRRSARSDQAYDARRAVAVDLSVPPLGLGPPVAYRTTGIAPGPPDPPALPDLLRRDLAASLLTPLAEAGPEVREITFGGRAAWLLDTVVRYDGPIRGRLRAVVDQRTALPLRITRWIGGRFLSDTTISRLALDRPVARDSFTVDVPEGIEVVDHDDGFRRRRLADVRRVAGYAAPVPRFVPRGFRLAEVATLTPRATCLSRCDAGHVPLPTGERMDNPVAGPVVSLAYRRGLEQFVVTARPTGPRPSEWKNPFGPPEVRLVSRRLRLRGGSLSGARAEVVVGAYALPQLWALGDELVLTVSGALSSRELVAVAQSVGR